MLLITSGLMRFFTLANDPMIKRREGKKKLEENNAAIARKKEKKESWVRLKNII